jgi:hypothetical protein
LFALITLRFILTLPSNGYASANTLILQALTHVGGNRPVKGSPGIGANRQAERGA